MQLRSKQLYACTFGSGLRFAHVFHSPRGTGIQGQSRLVQCCLNEFCVVHPAHELQLRILLGKSCSANLLVSLIIFGMQRRKYRLSLRYHCSGQRCGYAHARHASGSEHGPATLGEGHLCLMNIQHHSLQTIVASRGVTEVYQRSGRTDFRLLSQASPKCLLFLSAIVLR